MENQLPFSTDRKYMATIARVNGQRLLFIKGAPETVMALCQLTDEERTTNNHLLRGYQNKAMRTLAFAYKPLNNNEGKGFSEPKLDAGLHPSGLGCHQRPY